MKRTRIQSVLHALGGPTRVVKRLPMRSREPIWVACWIFIWVMVVWDVFLALDAVDGNTWSEVMRAASVGNPVLPWLFGILIGHLYHHRDDLAPIFDSDAAESVLMLLTLLLIVAGFVFNGLDGWQVTVMALAGIAAGYLLWPKHRQAEWHW